MDKEPKKFITKVLEFCAMFALAAFLLKLGISYLGQIWWALLIIALLAGAAIILYRLWQSKRWW